MKKIKLAVIGAGGYGDYCLSLLERFTDPESYTLAAVVDPFYEKIPRYSNYLSQKIPMFRTPGDFFAADSADLVLIASPSHLHKEQCLLALQNGAHVLCEKPLTPTLQDTRALAEAARRCGRALGVGFQLSFCEPMLALKRDIQAGLLGAPKALRAFVSWQRFDSYYRNSWHGRLRSADGRWLLDSILTNAAAHYLHNICFLLGPRSDTAAMPSSLRAELYNGKGIETFDTAFLSGSFPSGCSFFLALTHSGDRNIDPVLEYTFENAVVTAKSGSPDGLTAVFSDGTVRRYGDAFSESHTAQKLRTMIAAAGDPGVCVPCTAETVLPQLTVCNAVFDQAEISSLPSERMEVTCSPERGRFMRGLADDALLCFRTGLLPSERGLSWARPASVINLNGYTSFSGSRWAPAGDPAPAIPPGAPSRR